MNIELKKKIKDSHGRGFDNGSPYSERVGFWGTVDAVNSMTNRVTVISETGVIYPGIPVYSSEWVNADDNKDYITGSRNLPPIGARVFVLMPTKTVTGAFVLCSGYALGESKTKNLFAAENNKKEKFNTIKEKITQGGWNYQENYENGNIQLLSKDGKIKAELNVEDDSSDSTNRHSTGIVITAFDSIITVNDDGIKIKSENKDVTLVTQKFSVKSSEYGTSSLEVT